jgi:hypothetical protein
LWLTLALTGVANIVTSITNPALGAVFGALVLLSAAGLVLHHYRYQRR